MHFNIELAIRVAALAREARWPSLDRYLQGHGSPMRALER
jgi:hypothetical protein